VKKDHDPKNPRHVSQNPQGFNSDLADKPPPHRGHAFEFCTQFSCSNQQILLLASFQIAPILLDFSQRPERLKGERRKKGKNNLRPSGPLRAPFEE